MESESIKALDTYYILTSRPHAIIMIATETAVTFATSDTNRRHHRHSPCNNQYHSCHNLIRNCYHHQNIQTS